MENEKKLESARGGAVLVISEVHGYAHQGVVDPGRFRRHRARGGDGLRGHSRPAAPTGVTPRRWREICSHSLRLGRLFALPAPVCSFRFPGNENAPPLLALVSDVACCSVSRIYRTTGRDPELSDVRNELAERNLWSIFRPVTQYSYSYEIVI